MSTTNYPAPRPLLDENGKVMIPVTDISGVHGGAPIVNPHFEGSLYLNGISVFSTATDAQGNIVVNPLDPSKGGTGYKTLQELANKIADILGFTIGSGAGATIGIIPITKGGTGATTAAEALSALGGASAALYSVSVPVNWSDNASGGFIQTIALSGIRSTDVPVVGIVLSADVAAALLQGKAFANVNRITTATNSITLYCFSTKPTTAFSVQLLVVRGF